MIVGKPYHYCVDKIIEAQVVGTIIGKSNLVTAT